MSLLKGDTGVEQNLKGNMCLFFELNHQLLNSAKERECNQDIQKLLMVVFLLISNDGCVCVLVRVCVSLFFLSRFSFSLCGFLFVLSFSLYSVTYIEREMELLASGLAKSLLASS